MNLRELREQAGLTQAQVAERSGLSQSAISSMEIGVTANPQLDSLEAVAAALGCDLQTVIAALRASSAAA